MKIRILKDFIGRVNSSSVHFQKGWEGEINDEDADNMVRGHYAELIKPAVKIVSKPPMDKAVKIRKD